jgi:hypothetical protein
MAFSLFWKPSPLASTILVLVEREFHVVLSKEHHVASTQLPLCYFTLPRNPSLLNTLNFLDHVVLL